MNASGTLEPKGRMALGMVFIVIGLVLTLANAGVLDIQGISRWWPLFLIGIGLVKFRQPIEDGQRAAGVALLFVGSFFQLVSVLSWGKAWPLIMIMVGGLLLGQAVARPRAARPTPTDSATLSELALVGVLKRNLCSPDFKGGYITAVMGGVDLDLRKSRIGAAPAYVDVVALWGGIELKIPAGWAVEGRVVPFMGGFENKAQSLAEPVDSPRLVVRGYAVMGFVVISN